MNHNDINKSYNEFWEEQIAYHPLILHRLHRKLHDQQCFYCSVCISCSGNDFIEPLPNNDRVIHIYTHGLMGGINEVRR
jgi:hypothetical protein